HLPKLTIADEAARITSQRRRHRPAPRASPSLVERVGSPKESQFASVGARGVTTERDDFHVERFRAARERAPDAAIAEDAERLARELGPWVRRRRIHRPLALPDPAAQRRIQTGELARERQHRADRVL